MPSAYPPTPDATPTPPPGVARAPAAGAPPMQNPQGENASKPRIQSSQNGGAMEGWNDIPQLDMLTRNASSTSLSSKNRRRRVASASHAYMASPEPGRVVSAGTGAVVAATDGRTPPPPPPARK